MLAAVSWNTQTIAIVFGCAIPIVAIVAYYWHESVKIRSANALKRKMIERGMSVEEIERVLNAGATTKDF